MFSKRFMLSTSVLLSVALLSACHKPERVSTSKSGDSMMDCGSIQQEISYAEQAKARAREHDRFEFRYMLIVPAFISAYNFHKAEKAADERIENLQRLYNANNCANKPASQYNQQQQQQYSPYGSSPSPYGATPSPYSGTPTPYGNGGATYNYPYNGSQAPAMPGGMGQQQPTMPGGMQGGMINDPMMGGGNPMMSDPMMPGPGGEMPPPANYPGY